VLNQLGVIEMVDYVTPQIGVQFVVSQDYIQQQINKLDNQRKSAFLDTIFRQYGGEAFGKMKYLQFDYIQRKLDISPNAVKKGMQVLQDRDHMILYESIGELPLIKLAEERLSSLNLSRQKLEQHRNTLLQKLEYMMGYIETDTCREVYIRKYFGEDQVSPCGHCDNCLDRGQTVEQLSEKNLHQLRGILTDAPKTFNQIMQHFEWSRSKVKRLIGYLIREGKVVSEADKYTWKQ